MALRRLLGSLLAAWLGLAAAGAQAQPLQGPREVVLYLHDGLGNTDFVEPLVCALERVLVAPVRVRRLALPLGSELLATPTQYDVGKLADRFLAAAGAHGDATSFKYLLIAEDLKAQPYNYVFSWGLGGTAYPFSVGVLSTARLQSRVQRPTRDQPALATADRLYKLVLKLVARLSGERTSEGCVLSFPRDLDEFDRKPATFCPEDHARLVAAGVLRPKPLAGCAPVAALMPALYPP